jgi:hypothetical protein
MPFGSIWPYLAMRTKPRGGRNKHRFVVSGSRNTEAAISIVISCIVYSRHRFACMKDSKTLVDGGRCCEGRLQ